LLDQRINDIEKALDSRCVSVHNTQRVDTWKKELKRTREEKVDETIWSFMSCFDAFTDDARIMEPNRKHRRLEQLSRDYKELQTIQMEMAEQARLQREQKIERTQLVALERAQHWKRSRDEKDAHWIQRISKEQTKNALLPKTTCPFCSKRNLIGMVDHCRSKHYSLLSVAMEVSN
jgi:hypothetical protein